MAEQDTRISETIELEHEMLFNLMLQAHEQDITLNMLIANILREELKKDAK